MNSRIHKGKPQFLNKLAPQLFPELASKAKAKKSISSGELLVNGERVNFDARVFAGDEITFKGYSPKGKVKIKVFRLDLEVLYEDEFLAAVHKPGGIPVNGNQFKTLENALPHNLKPSKESDALNYPMPLHRLDAPTTGIVLIAKTNQAQVKMGRLFENKRIQKRYKAVVIGELPNEKGKVNEPIERKPSESVYEVVRSSPSNKYGKLTLVDLYPVTGRTHQLRIHMEYLGCPIVGDKQYPGTFDVVNGKGLMLCSDQVSFKHPITNKELIIDTQIPNKFKKYMEREAFRA